MGAAVAAAERFARFVLMNTAAFRDRTAARWRIRLCHVPLLGRLADPRAELVRPGGPALAVGRARSG